MNLIAAVDQNWGIGKAGRLLFHIPEDMQYFKKMTMGKTVVMGRKTFESIPGGALKGRKNLVLTREEAYHAAGITTVHSASQLMEAVAVFPPEDVFVIGGADVYQQLLGECKTAYITWVYAALEADVHLPDLDMQPQWHMTARSGRKLYKGTAYEFRVYRR